MYAYLIYSHNKCMIIYLNKVDIVIEMLINMNTNKTNKRSFAKMMNSLQDIKVYVTYQIILQFVKIKHLNSRFMHEHYNEQYKCNI